MYYALGIPRIITRREGIDVLHAGIIPVFARQAIRLVVGIVNRLPGLATDLRDPAGDKSCVPGTPAIPGVFLGLDVSRARLAGIFPHEREDAAALRANMKET